MKTINTIGLTGVLVALLFVWSGQTRRPAIRIETVTPAQLRAERTLAKADPQVYARVPFRESDGTVHPPLLVALYPAFAETQAAIEAAALASGGVVNVPAGLHVWPQPLDMRQAEWVELRFHPAARIETDFVPAEASYPAIDMTGAERCTIVNLRLTIRSGTTSPACGVFWGRSRYYDDADGNALLRCDIRGPFGDGHEYGGACVVNVGAEVFRLSDCCNLRFSGHQGEALQISAWNTHRVTSPYGVIAGGYVAGGGGAMSSCGGVVDGASHLACDNRRAGDVPAERCVVRLSSRVRSVWIHDVYVTAKARDSLAATFIVGNPDTGLDSFAGVVGVEIRNVHDESFASPVFVAMRGPALATSLSGVVVRAGAVYSVAEGASGLTLSNVPHRPDPRYWEASR